MKKILMVLSAAGMLSCGDSRQSERQDDTDDENGNLMEQSSGEDITPQLVPDDSLERTRHDVDTIHSAKGADRQSKRDSVD